MSSNQSAQAPTSADEWYYRLDGREHGPFSKVALQELVGSSGETAVTIDVRQGTGGDWKPFAVVFGTPVAPSSRSEVRHESPAVLPELPPPTSNASPRSKGRFADALRSNRDLVVIIGVWILANAAVLGWWSQEYRTERKYRAVLRGFETDVKALQDRDASPAEWSELRQRVKQTLAPMVADLKRSASASEPVRQHLLWAARDQFPKLVGPETAERKTTRRLYEKQMQLVDAELAE